MRLRSRASYCVKYSGCPVGLCELPERDNAQHQEEIDTDVDVDTATANWTLILILDTDTGVSWICDRELDIECCLLL